MPTTPLGVSSCLLCTQARRRQCGDARTIKPFFAVGIVHTRRSEHAPAHAHAHAHTNIHTLAHSLVGVDIVFDLHVARLFVLLRRRCHERVVVGRVEVYLRSKQTNAVIHACRTNNEQQLTLLVRANDSEGHLPTLKGVVMCFFFVFC